VAAGGSDDGGATALRRLAAASAVVGTVTARTGGGGGEGGGGEAPTSAAVAEDAAAWERLAHTIPAEKVRVWKALERGLGSYKAVLSSRAALMGECGSLEAENASLRTALARYLTPAYSSLQVPPAHTVRLGATAAAALATAAAAPDLPLPAPTAAPAGAAARPGAPRFRPPAAPLAPTAVRAGLPSAAAGVSRGTMRSGLMTRGGTTPGRGTGLRSGAAGEDDGGLEPSPSVLSLTTSPVPLRTATRS